MITKQDYAELIEKILDPEQPNYTYLSYHRTAVLCLIDTAPKSMRYSLIRPLLQAAFDASSTEVTTHASSLSPSEHVKWRYDLLRRLTKAGDYPNRFLDFFTTKSSEVQYGMNDDLVWIDAIAKQFGVKLSGRYLLAVIDHHRGSYDKQVKLVRYWLSGDELEVALFRIQRHADADERDRQERDYWRTPG